MHRGEQLRRLVVQRVRDPLGLLLEPFVQAAQRGVRLMVPAVHHLERREAFHEEGLCLGRSHGIRPRHCRLEGLVVQPHHLENAETFGYGSPSELVGARQRSLPDTREVVRERAAVRLQELAARLAHSPPPR